MNGKQTCGSLNDLKAICYHCGKKNFASHRSSTVQLFKKEKKLLVLSCWNCRLDIDCDLSEEKEWYGSNPGDFKTTQSELIYLPYNGEDMQKLRERFPTAHFSDGSDCIHPHRFSIEVEGISKKEFIKTLIQIGIFEYCLGVQLALRMPGKNKRLFEEILEELKTEHDPCIKEEHWK